VFFVEADTVSDYKDAMQKIADEMAQETYEKDFYDLPQHLQMEVYNEAMAEYVNRLCDQADQMLDASREQ
jgi:hypothetical protein